MSSGKCKFKQRDTTTQLSEWPTSKTLVTPNADKDYVEQHKLSFISGRIAK